MTWEPASDIFEIIKNILASGLFPHVDRQCIYAMRGYGSSSRAIARIWSLPKPWQIALRSRPSYVIEVIAEKFDHRSFEEKEKTLIHELMHIPKTFSGALVPHKNRGRAINSRNVDSIYAQYKLKNL
jgi:predicted metallopeptidase